MSESSQLSYEFFEELFAALKEQFQRDVSDTLSAIFYKKLQRLSPEQWEYAIERGIDEKFWPSPQRLLELGRSMPSQQVQAVEEPSFYELDNGLVVKGLDPELDIALMTPEQIKARQQGAALVAMVLDSIGQRTKAKEIRAQVEKEAAISRSTAEHSQLQEAENVLALPASQTEKLPQGVSRLGAILPESVLAMAADVPDDQIDF